MYDMCYLSTAIPRLAHEISRCCGLVTVDDLLRQSGHLTSIRLDRFIRLKSIGPLVFHFNLIEMSV